MGEQAPVHIRPSSHQDSGHQTALHRSAMVGNSTAIAALVKGGCALDLKDRDGNTALHEASWHGFSQCVKLLVKAGADVQIRNKAGNTALHLACQNAHAQTARLLLLGGSSPDTKNNMGDTCLHVAARYNNQTLVKILLKSQCSLMETNQGGDTALHVAATLNHKKTVQLLLEAGADGKIKNKAGKSALDKARDNNHREVALLLARSSQVHRFLRGRTIIKRKKRLAADHRTQTLPNKVRKAKRKLSSDERSAVEKTPNGGQVDSRTAAKARAHRQHLQHHVYLKTPASRLYGRARERRVREQLVSNDSPKGQNDSHVLKDLLCDDGGDRSTVTGKTYQLYTLYRDREGKVKQAPASGCHCKSVLKKLEEQVKATQGEMRLHILNVQEEVNSRLGKIDRRNRHQIKVLDMLNQERVAEERRNMLYRMEQKAAQVGQEALLKQQAAVRHELKKWCVSQVNDLDVHISAEAQYYKLLPSPSMERSVAEAELESLPLLSVFSGDSSASLATYVNILPSKSSHSLRGPEQEQTPSGTYFEMKVDRSPDDYENTALFPMPAKGSSGLMQEYTDPPWQSPGVQGNPMAAVLPLFEEGFSSSSSQSSIGGLGPQMVPAQQQSCGTKSRRHFRGVRMRSCRRSGIRADDTTTLEFFIDRPSEPTFSQERNSLHAMEVTQCFFETVSTQLERWCQRKILEVEQQAELRAQQDREELLQRIGSLEEELQRLKTSENMDSVHIDNDQCSEDSKN
ncbi:ankyrin repeat domain-containing protein 6 [Salarias fasciatus]|uniref:ankyrin repeat domain-containing protein 6 n=1 Tax=Salarias fasciatus TaxID=181472 RepID=UPI001176E005|nr:ankyrin repeat domain-containing protein 6-like [Salarias fasciatus]